MLRYVQRSGERNWFERPEGMSELMHRLLMQRGIASAQEAQIFLYPGKAQLHDPMLLHDMPEAAARLRRAMDAGETICVYGDYDVDGVCASAILSGYLLSEGADVEVYIPMRQEGYGLNERAVREIAGRAKLLVTMDCGIKEAELIALAQSLGLDCIVTDHHEPSEVLPGCLLVNPLLGDYPFRRLCGAGVAFKLVSAVAGLDRAMEWIDLAAIATVADIVSLTEENRAIVSMGLKRINTQPRPGVAALMECAKVQPGKLTSNRISFGIGPRLNSAGRMGSARRAYELLMQRDSAMAAIQAAELEEENTRRKEIDSKIQAEAEAQLNELDFSAHRILFAWGEGWEPGVVGLVASHLKDKYGFPTIILSENDGVLTGSCRSIDGVNIHQALTSAAPLMVRFGGHVKAAGITVRSENLRALWDALDAYLFENAPAELYLPSEKYDVEAGLDELSEDLVHDLEAIEPTGMENPAPVFRSKVQLVGGTPCRTGSLMLTCAENGAQLKGFLKDAAERANELRGEADILFAPRLNVYKNVTSVQLDFKALREPDDFARMDAAQAQEGPMQRRFLTELFYNKRISCEAPAPQIDLRELKRRLAAGIQGTFILCGGLEIARMLMKELEPCPLDLCIGKLPEDVRGFNSLIVWPERLEGFPKALRTLVLAGLPAPDAVPSNVEVLSLPVQSALRGELPDVDQMRNVYVAARELIRRPIQLWNMESLNARLSEASGLSPTCCHVSVLALRDMKLVEICEEPFGLNVPAGKKADPQSNALWRAVTQFRDLTEGRSADERR